ncbi:MAG: hypothetical protein ACQEQ0_03405 [Bacteroidota bacterium]
MSRFTTKMLLPLFLFWAGYMTALAQPQPSGDVEKIISSEEHFYMNAEWSPDGKTFAFSAEKYNGIWISDAGGDEVRQITSDRSAGFGFSWSPDGRTILARPVLKEGGQRFHQVKLYDVGSGEEDLLVPATRSLERLPVWSQGGRKVVMKKEGRKKAVESGKGHLKSRFSEGDKGLNFGGALVTVPDRDGSDDKDVEFPGFDGHYVFNCEVSPDGEKMVFEVSGLGLFVSNTDGSDKQNIGRGEHASWMPGSRFVVVTRVEDDGHTITSGNLFAVDTRTGDYFPLLSGDDVIALKPSVSPQGDKVLFDDPRTGDIYMIKISNQ